MFFTGDHFSTNVINMRLSWKQHRNNVLIEGITIVKSHVRKLQYKRSSFLRQYGKMQTFVCYTIDHRKYPICTPFYP